MLGKPYMGDESQEMRLIDSTGVYNHEAILRRIAENANIKASKWPNPANGIVTSSFGERNNPVLKKQEFHDGMDIAAPEGTDIIAVGSGKIIEVRTSLTYGNVVKYEIGNGYTVMYAHCKEILVQKGDMIEQGQIIATIGSTGLVTGPHLHYTLWKDDQLIDPLPFTNLPIAPEVYEEYKQRGETFN